MTELLQNIWAVRVPKDAYDVDLDLYPKDDWYFINYLCDDEEDVGYNVEILPGNYSLIGVGISEEVAEKVTPGFGKYDHWDYENPGQESMPFYLTATESLISLLKSKGLNTEDNYVFLKLND